MLRNHETQQKPGGDVPAYRSTTLVSVKKTPGKTLSTFKMMARPTNELNNVLTDWS